MFIGNVHLILCGVPQGSVLLPVILNIMWKKMQKWHFRSIKLNKLSKLFAILIS